jgi:hypothetical protein
VKFQTASTKDQAMTESKTEMLKSPNARTAKGPFRALLFCALGFVWSLVFGAWDFTGPARIAAEGI